MICRKHDPNQPHTGTIFKTQNAILETPLASHHSANDLKHDSWVELDILFRNPLGPYTCKCTVMYLINLKCDNWRNEWTTGSNYLQKWFYKYQSKLIHYSPNQYKPKYKASVLKRADKTFWATEQNRISPNLPWLTDHTICYLTAQFSRSWNGLEIWNLAP